MTIGEAVASIINTHYYHSFDPSNIISGCKVFVLPLSISEIEALKQFGATYTAQFSITIRPLGSDLSYFSMFPAAITTGHADFQNASKGYFLSKAIRQVLNSEYLSTYIVEPHPTPTELNLRPKFAFEVFFQPAHEHVEAPYTSLHHGRFKFIYPGLIHAPFKKKAPF
jgi:hypothetical protein